MATAADLLDDLRLKPAEGGIAEGMPQDRKGRACFFWNHRLRHRVWDSRRPAAWPAAFVGGGMPKVFAGPGVSGGKSPCPRRKPDPKQLFDAIGQRWVLSAISMR